MDKRDAAVWLAEMGFYIVPLAAGRKIPTRKGWQALATNDPARVEQIWTLPDGNSAEYNPGINGREHVILDIDVPGASHGQADGMAELAKLGWTGKTFSVRTPSGGMHLYFRKPEGVDFSQTDLAPGINVRSSGGFVCGPGSWTRHVPGKQVEGWYRLKDQCPPAELPECIAIRLTLAGAAGSFDESEYEGEWDYPHSVEWCWRYVREWAPKADKGRRGRTGLEVAHVLGDYAISKDVALDMLQVWHAENCDPPEDPENQMEKSLNSAYNGRKTPFGRLCAHDVLTPVVLPESVTDEYRQRAEAIGASKQAMPVAWRVKKPKIRTLEDERSIPQIPWLVRHKFIRGSTTVLIAPPGAGKSTLTLHWAIALATGNGAFCGLPQVENAEPINTLVVGVEDPQNILEMRLAAACKYHEIDRERVCEHVHLISAQDTGELNLMAKADKRAILKTTEQAKELVAYILKHDIRFVILDPLIEFHDAEENDNGEMKRIMSLLRDVASLTGAAIVVVHHTRKPPQGSSDNYAGDANAGRGASAITGSIRSGFTLFSASLKDVETYKEITEENRRDYVRLDDAKANWFKMSPNATWFKRSSVQLANGESQPVFEIAHLTTGDDDSDSMLREDAAALLKKNEEASISSVALALCGREPYKAKGERTIRRKLASAFAQGTVTTSRGTVQFFASGKEGGTFMLTGN